VRQAVMTSRASGCRCLREQPSLGMLTKSVPTI
jgi:hypothetical protein